MASALHKAKWQCLTIESQTEIWPRQRLGEFRYANRVEEVWIAASHQPPSFISLQKVWDVWVKRNLRESWPTNTNDSILNPSPFVPSHSFNAESRLVLARASHKQEPRLPSPEFGEFVQGTNQNNDLVNVIALQQAAIKKPERSKSRDKNPKEDADPLTKGPGSCMIRLTCKAQIASLNHSPGLQFMKSQNQKHIDPKSFNLLPIHSHK